MDLPNLLSEEPNGLGPWKRGALLVGGSLCMLLGVVFWLIPVVTGIPFYVLGFVLLGLASPRAARGINALDRRLPLRARQALRSALARRKRPE